MSTAEEQAQALDQRQQRELEATGANVAHQQHADPHQQAEEIRENLLEFLTESELDEGSKELLRNYTTKSFILGYLQDGEVEELKWDLRISHQLYLAEHPGPECDVTGDVRAHINNDASDQLSPLTGSEKLVLQSFFQAIWTNITRARGMKQQEIMKTQIARTETERQSQSDGGGGLLDRIRS